MRLKNLELVGFKSFADRALLEFGEGISAIVGPNGCGKSNVSDAIRWVLGEQSARLLRGVKMEDCIFNGTDALPPKNMAEVSLTLTDCEKILGTDYHEVTITRRVFRSGEGQYFINKTPCRLKDIQRLFMDTGLGSNSYSVIEQGKIDLILRARPEDRREVFEEASGITKYKADKREALRKLEQTENNLLRLADIIKEVKRQIISIQRQAGKAERYKKMFEQMRGYDVYAARERLKSMAEEISAMDAQHASLVEKNEALQHDVENTELDDSKLQEARVKIEGEIAALQQAAMQVDSQISNLQQSLESNSQRLEEHRKLIKRDTRDSDTAAGELNGFRKAITEGAEKLKNAEAKLREAEENLKAKSEQNARHEEELDKAKNTVQELSTESMDLVDRLTKSQNELSQLENADRVNASRREHRAAEQKSMRLLLVKHQERETVAEKTVQEMRQAVENDEQALRKLENETGRNEEQVLSVQAEVNRVEKEIAALTAQLEILGPDDAPSAKPGGSGNEPELAAHGIARENLLGRLFEQIKVQADYRVAFEAVLRDLLDAFILKDVAGAVKLISAMDKESKGAWSFVVADMASLPATANPPPGSVGLLEKTEFPDQFRPLFTRLLQNVYVVESADFLKDKVDSALICVTRKGVVIRGTGAVQVGTKAPAEESPALRQERRKDIKARLLARNKEKSTAQEGLNKLQEIQKGQKEMVAKTQAELNAKRVELGKHEGQHSLIKDEADKTRDNLETVSYELKEIEKEADSTARKSELLTGMDEIRARQVTVKHDLNELNARLKTLEKDHKKLQEEVMDANGDAVRRREEVGHLAGMETTQKERITQIESLISDRNDHIREYEKTIADLESANKEVARRLPLLQEQKVKNAEEQDQIRKNRDKLLVECKNAGEKLKKIRATWDAQRTQQSDLNGKVITLRIKREHLLERMTSEYHLAEETVLHAAEPEWPETGKPSPEQLDSLIAEMRAKIEAMGPVNTGAIEELQQLQERHEFLSKQQDDLVKARQQLLDAIKKINQTTTEMFASTFAKINENFQTMFSRLFGGGSAKLILTDEGDILECGIEIYAHPPGKKLQSISLLSGGESTMTAVALLFAIFMVKPSPFCVLDEIDAALDDANNQRFINMLKGFLADSQFIVITHNRQTIAAASVLYGVTMEKNKISTMVSMRFEGSGKVEKVEKVTPEADKIIIQAKN